MRDLIIWGATGQAKVLHELIHGTDLRLVALVDRRPISSPFPSVPILLGETGLDAWLGRRAERSRLMGAIAIGGGHGADRITLQAVMRSRGIEPVTLIHRTAFVAHDAVLGDGCQILAQSSVCTHVRLGSGTIVNTGASVDHDCVIEEGVHIGPGTCLAGEIRVGARTFIGAGAVVLPRVEIGADVVIGAGAVVTSDVPASIVVVGNPARKLRESHR